MCRGDAIRAPEDDPGIVHLRRRTLRGARDVLIRGVVERLQVVVDGSGRDHRAGDRAAVRIVVDRAGPPVDAEFPMPVPGMAGLETVVLETVILGKGPRDGGARDGGASGLCGNGICEPVLESVGVGYDVHITRADEWFDSEKKPITLEEWKQLVANDPEVRLDGEAVANADGKPVLSYQDEGLAVWTAHSGHDPNGNMAWFDHRGGEVVVKNPDDEILEKMRRIAGRDRGDTAVRRPRRRAPAAGPTFACRGRARPARRLVPRTTPSARRRDRRGRGRVAGPPLGRGRRRRGSDAAEAAKRDA